MSAPAAPAAVPRPRLTALRAWLPALVAGGVAVALPLEVTKGYDLSRLQLTFVYMMAAMALNFAYGYAGQLALGQPVLLGVGAYASGLLSVHRGWELHQTLIPAIVVALVVSVLMGLPSLRVRGWYFAVLTFFGILVFPELVMAFRSVTGGEDGLVGIAPISWNGERMDLRWQYEIVLAATLLTALVFRNAVRSGWGRSLHALRDHPAAADAAGLSTSGAKARVYLLIAVPCAVAGSTLAHSNRFIAPEQFGFDMILLLLGGVFIGGVGTLWGPLVGVALFQGISLWIGPFSEYNPLVLGLGVLASAVLFRGGLVPAAGRLAASLRRGPDDDTAADGSPGADARVIPLPLPVIDAGEVGVTITGLAKAFGTNPVLTGIDLEVGGGQVVALVGANGCGKTTLLNVVNGFHQADGGRVRANGVDTTALSVRQVAHVGVGRTFQVPKLVEDLTVRQNVELGILGRERQRMLAAILRLPGFRRRERARAEQAGAICRALGFDDATIDVPASHLSLGLKRIAEIGRAIAGGASVICLDEPAAGLNDEERERLGRICRSLADSGRAVLLVEHHLRFVLDICDRLVLLDDGRVAAEGRPQTPGSFGPALERYLGTYLVDFRADAATAG